MVNRTNAALLDNFVQTPREQLFYIEFNAFFCSDQRRADTARRFGAKHAASARYLSTYSRLFPQNFFHKACRRKYATLDRFAPLFKHSAERVPTWIRARFGDNTDQKLRRTVPCESASDLVKLGIKTLTAPTRAIAGQRQVNVDYLLLTSEASTKTLCPLELADIGPRWHLRAYVRELSRFADFALTGIVKEKSIDKPIPIEEQIESDVNWMQIVYLELVPQPSIGYLKAIEADFTMNNGELTLDMRDPLIDYALTRWSFDYLTKDTLTPKERLLLLKNLQILYGVESADLAPRYTINSGSMEYQY